MSEFVTQEQFKDFTSSIREDLKDLSATVKTLGEAVTKLGNSIDLMEANSITKNDDRYRKKCDMMVDAKTVLDDSEFIDKCQLLIKRTIVEYACETRDSTIKWWQLILIGAMFASFAFNAYNNNIIIKNQKVLEKNQTTNTNSIMNNNQKGDKQ